MKARVLVVAPILLIGASRCASRNELGKAPSFAGVPGADRVTTSCGEFFEPPRFAGRVLARLPDGSTLPIQGVVFKRAIGEDGLKDGSSWATDISTDGGGAFDAAVGISTSSTTWSRAGKDIKSEGWVEDVVFELGVQDCNPLVVLFPREGKQGVFVQGCQHV